MVSFITTDIHKQTDRQTGRLSVKHILYSIDSVVCENFKVEIVSSNSLGGKKISELVGTCGWKSSLCICTMYITNRVNGWAYHWKICGHFS